MRDDQSSVGRLDWFNNDRLLSSIGDIPPVEYEQLYYADAGGTGLRPDRAPACPSFVGS